LCVLLLGSVVLLKFAFAGPFSFIQPVHAALNPEGIVAIGFIALCAVRAKGSQWIEAEAGKASYDLTCIGLIVIGTVLAFSTSLNDPFLADDYGLIGQASTDSLHQVVSRTLLTHPTSGDFFFRPVTYLLSWLDFRWAGYNPLLWHVWNLLVHATNSVLVFVWLRQLRFRAAVSCLAALLFAIHGARPEVVCWVGSRYDLLAFLFSALTLISTLRYVESPAIGWLITAFISTTLAVLSKESAFCIPLVLAAVLFFGQAGWNKNGRRVLICVSTACLAVLFYRTWFLGGIGGYRDGEGTAAVAQFHPLLTLKGLFFRGPAILLFPINWSLSVSPAVIFALAAMLVCLFAAALTARLPRRPLFCSLAVILVAFLPVQHLLLIGPELTGSRVLYLPTLGFALLWATILSSITPATLRTAFACLLLISELVFLRHNISIWQEVAHLSQQVCRDVGAMTKGGHPVFVTDLPATFKGVYFLANGFPGCVSLASNSGPPGVVQVKQFDGSVPCNSLKLVWNNDRAKFEQYRGTDGNCPTGSAPK
jgi:hypothetical protein